MEQLYSNLKKRVKIVLTGEYKLFFSNTSQRGEDKKYNDHFTLRISDTSATIYKMENGNRGSVAFAGDLEWVSDVACFNLKSKTEKQDRIFWMIRVKENSSDEYFSGLYLTINDKNQPTGGNFIIIKSNLAIDNNKLTRAFFLAIDNIGNGKLAVLDLLDREVKKTVFSNLAKIDKIAGYWKAIRWNEEASKKRNASIFSCYCIVISNDSHSVEISSVTCDFEGYLQIDKNNRITIKAEDITNDINFKFTSLLPDSEFKNLTHLSGVFNRITKKHIRAGHMVLVPVEERFKGCQLQANQFTGIEKLLVKDLVKNKLSIK